MNFRLLALCMIGMVPAQAGAEASIIVEGHAYLEDLQSDLSASYSDLMSAIGDISLPMTLSALAVAEAKIKTFRQVRLESYKNSLLDYCRELDQLDSKIVKDVQSNADTRRSGPTPSQIQMRDGISAMRPYCATAGAGILRRTKYWNEYAALDADTHALYNIVLGRLKTCENTPRCANGTDNG